MWPVYWTTILVQTCNHTATSFVNSDWPYIPLGSHCALLPVGLCYILLALGLSVIPFLCCCRY